MENHCRFIRRIEERTTLRANGTGVSSYFLTTTFLPESDFPPPGRASRPFVLSTSFHSLGGNFLGYTLTARIKNSVIYPPDSFFFQSLTSLAAI